MLTDQVAVLGTERSTVDLVANAFECQQVSAARIGQHAESAESPADIPYLLAVHCLTKVNGADPKPPQRSSADSFDVPMVLVLPEPTQAAVLQAMRCGAFDVLTLPPTEQAIKDLIARARLCRQDMMLRRLRTISQFSGWLAHELRNPLTGILNSAQLSLECMAPTDSVQRYLKIIIEEGGRLEQLLRRVTEPGRPARGLLGPASLNTVVERALAHVAPRLEAQGIQLRRRLDSQVPHVRIDVTRVESTVSRMIASAAETMPAGGTLTVRTGYRPDERMIELEVTDSNSSPSSAQERQRKLFGLCVTSRPTEADLGLAFALMTFAEYGGDLSLRIDLGRGGSILARLPLNGQ